MAARVRYPTHINGGPFVLPTIGLASRSLPKASRARNYPSRHRRLHLRPASRPWHSTSTAKLLEWGPQRRLRGAARGNTFSPRLSEGQVLAVLDPPTVPSQEALEIWLRIPHSLVVFPPLAFTRLALALVAKRRVLPRPRGPGSTGGAQHSGSSFAKRKYIPLRSSHFRPPAPRFARASANDHIFFFHEISIAARVFARLPAARCRRRAARSV